MNITFDPEILAVAPQFKVIKVEATIENNATSDALWKELLDEGERIRTTYDMPMINKRPGIAATRLAYKSLGKEPNRYTIKRSSLPSIGKRNGTISHPHHYRLNQPIISEIWILYRWF